MASKGIYLRGGTYWGRVKINGKSYRRSLQTADEQAAEAAYKDFRAEIVEFNGTSPTWKQAMVNWGELYGTAKNGDDGLRESTREGYREILMAVSSQWRDKRLSEIGPKAIGEWVKLRKKGFTYRDEEGHEHVARPCTNATARRTLTAISSVFRAAMAVGMVNANPVLTWDRKVIPEKKRFIVPPLPEEIEVALSYAHRNLRRALEFASNTGMRKMEVARLEWRDIRLEEGYVLLDARTKGRRPRTVQLVTPGGDARGTLRGTPRHVRAQWVFWHSHGIPYASLTNAFKDVMARAVRDEARKGLILRPFRLHDLRHAFAVRWLLAGGDIYQLSRHLGHTSVKTTEANYLSMIDEYQERAREVKARGHNPGHTLTSSNVVPLVAAG